ncbi:hypothetical protein F2Q70_00039245 [Brassica cretica]|uniref:Uncharacterized protein n=1 Tax=Brassica cretica TaxID=69181 RepID=A0A8S9K8Q5_BRACR|nr:hypothetical protein F2Q70_00039245 [Brassica cretica]KAF2617913.1 hypothetical protein F2Q68_00039935 [Brassica cretica]
MFSRCVMSQFVRFLSGLSISSVVIVSVDRFRDVSVQTASMELGSYLYSSCTSYVWMSRVIQRFIRDGAEFMRCHSWDGLAVMTSSGVGLPEGKSSYSWSR